MAIPKRFAASDVGYAWLSLSIGYGSRHSDSGIIEKWK
jgi:hypothetical protein